jgi:hypothetical protein
MVRGAWCVVCGVWCLRVRNGGKSEVASGKRGGQFLVWGVVVLWSTRQSGGGATKLNSKVVKWR